ncbi:Fibroblast growth factor receptor 4 [Branchiostoma belcheri]|nr:Fibroblast growth factor receptor 4 [Branchiostoma belcheri]
MAERSPSPPVLAPGLPQNQTVVVGSTVDFQCRVFSDSRPHIQWLKHYEVNGSYVDANGKPHVRVLKLTSMDFSDTDTIPIDDVSGTTSGIGKTDAAEKLIIRDVEESDAGKYTCRAESYLGSTADVNNIDQNLEKLVLRNVTEEDAGQYTVSAGNSIGFSYNSAWLTIIPEYPTPPTEGTRKPVKPEKRGNIAAEIAVYSVGGVFLLTIFAFVAIYYFRFKRKQVPKSNEPPLCQLKKPLHLKRQDYLDLEAPLDSFTTSSSQPPSYHGSSDDVFEEDAKVDTVMLPPQAPSRKPTDNKETTI